MGWISMQVVVKTLFSYGGARGGMHDEERLKQEKLAKDGTSKGPTKGCPEKGIKVKCR
jgi:hypothetical protein